MLVERAERAAVRYASHTAQQHYRVLELAFEPLAPLEHHRFEAAFLCAFSSLGGAC
jgi:hypothetical protein